MLNKLALPLMLLPLSINALAEANTEANTEAKADIDFSNPTSVYSAVDINVGTDGIAMGFSLSGSITDNWAFISKLEVRENTDMYRARVAAISNSIGSGVMVDYVKHKDFHEDLEDSKSDTLVINAMQVLPLNEGKTLIVPIVGMGYTDNDIAKSKTNIWMVQAMFIQNWTANVWTNFAPIWTNSFDDMEMKYGLPDQRIKSFDMELINGYRFNGNQNVRLHINHNEDDTTEAWMAYTYAF